MKRPDWLITSLILILSGVIRGGLLAFNLVPFNSDEAIVGLMARHILNGEIPIFFYGQAYMGSLDAIIVAIFFALLGEHIWVIRLVQMILFSLTIISTIQIGYLLYNSKRAAWMSASLLAIPAVNLTLYSTVSLGGYGEALLIGNLLLWMGLWIIQNQRIATKFHWFLLGGLAGVGLWANGLTLVYSFPVGGVLLAKEIKLGLNNIHKKVPWAILGVIFGALPFLFFAFRYGFSQLITELSGGAVAVETTGFFLRALEHLGSLLLFGSTAVFGFRPPWGVTWLMFPLIPFVLALWLWILWKWGKSALGREGWINGRILPILIIGILCLGFVFTSFGVDPSGRYFLPVQVMLAFGAGFVLDSMRKSDYIKAGLFLFLLVFNLGGNIQSAKYPPGFTTQFYGPAQVDQRYMGDLITFLKTKAISRGYTNYWVAYPLAFSTKEEIIFSPRMPYHPDLRYTSRDDRYPSYTQMVEKSSSIAYITSNNPLLDEIIRKEMKDADVSWEEEKIGDFLIFFNLSQPIQPADFSFKWGQ